MKWNGNDAKTVQKMKSGMVIVVCAVVTLSLFLSCPVWAYGGWLEETPIGGMTLGPGDDASALKTAVAAIAAENTAAPFIVTRTKQLKYIFEHVALGVNTNDVFVHWHPGTFVLCAQREARIAAFAASHPSRRNCGGWMCRDGAYNTRLDTSHTCPDWESVIALGPKGLAARARRRRETAKTADEQLFLDCIAEVYEALAGECVRWAELCERAGMHESGAVLREIAQHEPRTFREALQWSLVYDRAQEAEGEDVRSQGLFDRLFIRFYRNDLAAGRETRESAKRLIVDYYTRLWAQNHPNCKNIAFGGYDREGNVVWNELTELGFEVFRELGRPNPKLTFRFGKKTPGWQVEKVCVCLAEGKTSIVFACEETLRETFSGRGKEPEDLADFVLVGCYEPGIGGREIVASMAADINLAKPVETVFASAEPPVDFDDFRRRYFAELGSVIDEAAETAVAIERHWFEIHPTPLFSGSFRDAVASARDAYDGGLKYNSSGIECTGLGTVADSFAAINDLTNVRKACSLPELVQVVRKDWKDSEKLRLLARHAAPKWGNNDDRVDTYAKEIYDFAADRINAKRNGHGGDFQAGFWSIYLDQHFGHQMGATPEGRHKGEMLSRNNVATAGCGKEGPTALMNSNLKLDQRKCEDGHIMDVVLPVSKMQHDVAAKHIAAIIATYFEQGGQCLHLNTFDASTLREAMSHPEKYPDLQVRVCGWNVLWSNLSKEEQIHFLRTCEAQE